MGWVKIRGTRNCVKIPYPRAATRYLERVTREEEEVEEKEEEMQSAVAQVVMVEAG